MATIVTRAGKGSPLTNAEVDANFTNLNNDKLEAAYAALITLLGFTPANKAGDTFTGAVLTSNAGGFTANSAAKLWTDSGRGRIDLWESSAQTKSFLLLNTNAGGRIGMVSNEPLEIVTNNTAHLFLTAAGWFGVGKSVPSGPLHVKGANGVYVEGALNTNVGRVVMTGSQNEILAVGLNGIYTNGRVKLGAGAITPANGGWIDSFADGQTLFYGASSAEVARFSTARFFGIGTSTPANKLTVQDTVDTYAQVATTAADGIAGVVLVNDARSWVLRNNGVNGDAFEIRDATANAQRLVITTAGDATFSHQVSATQFNGSAAGLTGLRTVNGNSIVGSGNIQIDGGVTSFNTRVGAVTLSSGDVTTALGFTPYSATNPSGYTSNTGTVTSVGGTGTVSGLTLSGSVTGAGNLTLGGTLSLTSGNVTGALGYTPPQPNGTGASGTWGISITGSAGSAGSVAWTNVSGRPTAVSSFSNDSGYITSGGRAYPRRSDGGDLNFYWSGQSGQPPWLWGGNDGANMYVYNPSNFSVNYANSAGTASRATRANGNFYIDDNYGNTVVGVYNASRYQGVFAMGDAYKLPSDGTGTGGLYGMAWSHPNAGGAAGNLTDHGLLIINGGGFRCAISNSIVASGNITAFSDERLKTNWRDMPENFVARLAQVKVGIYDRTDEEDVTQVGVSAQSFQQLLPQAIMTAKDEMKTLSVNYGGAALASAVELAKDNIEMRARIEKLEALVSKLIEG